MRIGGEDLVGAVDAVITKPGYGILSESIATGTPLLYVMNTLGGDVQRLTDVKSDRPTWSTLKFIAFTLEQGSGHDIAVYDVSNPSSPTLVRTFQYSGDATANSRMHNGEVRGKILHAGYYDDNPRAREVVWIMLAQRCARGLASLYAHANEFDIKQAKAFQVEWTPRGWMRPDLDLLGFEQQLYLRQPGYGTSYITGKYLLEQLLAERSHQLGEAFTLSRYFTELNAAGLIPVSMIQWEMTGVSP